MITEFATKGLNGKINCKFMFHNDVNVITGLNGSGKTTVLKLIWYMISGNIERIPREMFFDMAWVRTEDAGVLIEVANPSAPKDADTAYRLKYSVKAKDAEHVVSWSDIHKEIPVVREANHLIAKQGGSIFFPTFRRIEGGFATQKGNYLIQSDQSPREEQLFYGDSVADTLNRLSKLLSLFEHQFISSISTTDLVQLLTLKYAEVSRATNANQNKLTEEIFATIRKYKSIPRLDSNTQLEDAKTALENIADLVGVTDDANKDLLRPFTMLSSLIERIFPRQGIRMTNQIILGNADPNSAIDSGSLSSGEKQMLSFLCYNAFDQGIPIFVDEPELSLHADWQRILVPTLLSQRSSNQFIIATHSPFIYSKYEDREFRL